MNAWREAHFKSIANEETEEYKNWNKENEKLFQEIEILLDEFYKDKEVPSNLKMEVNGPSDGSRIHGGGNDYKPISQEFPKNNKEKKELETRLKQYQNHMTEFTEFLKEKYLQLYC